MGLSIASNDELKGGNLQKNKEILMAVLKGNGSRPQSQVVALNTALVLWAFGIENNLRKGVERAMYSLENESAWNKFKQLKQFLGTDIP